MRVGIRRFDTGGRTLFSLGVVVTRGTVKLNLGLRMALIEWGGV